MDHAFGFQTVDEIEPHQMFISLYSFFLFVSIYFNILAFFLGYFLIKHEILFTNFARAEFECTLSFVSLPFISLL